MLSLQAHAGNRAVSRLFAGGPPDLPSSLQRQDAPAAAPAADPVEALLNEIAPAIGRAREVPPPEVISGTTAGEFSYRDFDAAIGRLWRRQRLGFTAAARRAASADSPTPSLGGRGTAPRAAQANETPAGEQFGQRWALNLLTWNYQRWTDLPDIAELMRRGSPFDSALRAEYNPVIQAPNLTGGQMRDRIVATIVDLSLALQPGQTGQLMINFTGHGGGPEGGGIYGVDGQGIEPTWLIERAQFAAQMNVQLVYVLDTCRAGMVAQLAQRYRGERAQEAANRLPGAGQSAVQPLLNFRRQVANGAGRMGLLTISLGDAARQIERHPGSSRSRRGELSQRDAQWLTIVELLNSIGEFNNELYDDLGRPPAMAPPVADLRRSVAQLSLSLLAALSANLGALGRALRQIAVVLDQASDYQNRLNDLIDRQLEAQTASSAAGAGQAASRPPT